MAPRLPDADLWVLPQAEREISRFPNKERLRMPGSTTTPDPRATRNNLARCIAFHVLERVGTRNKNHFVAQWLACTSPCRRFAGILTNACAGLGADVVVG